MSVIRQATWTRWVWGPVSDETGDKDAVDVGPDVPVLVTTAAPAPGGTSSPDRSSNRMLSVDACEGPGSSR